MHAPITARLEPDRRVGGKYVLRRRLAIGGMGELWLARNESTHAEVVLKVLRGSADPSVQAEERFRNEARLSATLSHRNIVRIFDLIEDGDTLVLVMELLRGETLNDFLTRAARLGVEEAVAIVVPILSALDHAHKNGIVHRDVTPANIFLAVDPDGQVTPKLVDFGIAKSNATTVQTVDGSVLGTPRYMSPEQIRGESVIDAKSDVFSVGVVLYEMLSGASPFARTSPAASLAAVLETEVDPDPQIDPRLWIEVKRALAKRPYERHASAAEMASSLRSMLGASDASLADALRRIEVRVQDLSADGASKNVIGGSGNKTPDAVTVDGQSLVIQLSKRKYTWAFRGAGAAVVGLFLLLLFKGLLAEKPSTTSTTAAQRGLEPGTTAAVAASSMTAPAVPAAPAVGAADAGAVPSAAEPSSNSRRASSAGGVPVNPPKKNTPLSGPKPKPIATTPGF